MTTLALEVAQRLIQGAFQKAASLNFKPLCVVIVDAGGHVIAVARQDGASTLRPQIAMAKACGALALGVSSRKIGEMAVERPTFIASLGLIAANGIIPAAGGLIIVDSAGCQTGAIGITGETSDNDELCAYAAVSAVGLDVLI